MAKEESTAKQVLKPTAQEERGEGVVLEPRNRLTAFYARMSWIEKGFFQSGTNVPRSMDADHFDKHYMLLSSRRMSFKDSRRIHMINDGRCTMPYKALEAPARLIQPWLQMAMLPYSLALQRQRSFSPDHYSI